MEPLRDGADCPLWPGGSIGVRGHGPRRHSAGEGGTEKAVVDDVGEGDNCCCCCCCYDTAVDFAVAVAVVVVGWLSARMPWPESSTSQLSQLNVSSLL